mmetsp:Transcript_89232/g.186489  ORF Transcript_89232/g.186489 Transcript_89232/m.186489 type:complete len:99 (-) Transcript_89232:7-303(-)
MLDLLSATCTQTSTSNAIALDGAWPGISPGAHREVIQAYPELWVFCVSSGGSIGGELLCLSQRTQKCVEKQNGPPAACFKAVALCGSPAGLRNNNQVC